jgi:hypothetical protein
LRENGDWLPDIHQTRVQMDDLSELVREALEFSRESRQGCFVSNEAANELFNYGTAAVEPIETGVLSRVASVCGNDRTPSECGYPGTVHVMVAYFRLLYQHELIERGRDFLTALPPTVLFDALHGAFIVEGNSPASKYTLNEPLQRLVEKLASDGATDQRVRELITRNCRLRCQ